MFLFDTDVLSNIIKRKPSDVLIDKLQTVPKKSQYTSSINIGEIYYGAYKSNRRDQILKAFEESVFPNINVLFFDEESGKLFGRLKAKLEKKGISCSEPDLRIASVALQHNLKLVTGNIKHFENIPEIRLENWITG
jgi:predicted nucleic acid-binding protein